MPITNSEFTVNDYNETKHQEAEIVSVLPPPSPAIFPN